MKKVLFILTALLLAANAFGAETAASAMQKVAAKLKSMPAMEIDFVITSGKVHDSGKLTIAGTKFVYATRSMASWYDGKTQWAYLASSGEVNVTEPTAEEVVESNPLAILNGYASRFNVSMVKQSGASYTVRLTPKSKSNPVASADVTINGSTWLPTGLTIKFAHGSPATVSISSIRKIAAPAASTFRYPKGKFPGAEIIDLR